MSVSIIMPFYNGEKFIAETINSILNQTFSDWKLICIDDFSSDRSNEIVQEFATRDARIICFSNVTKGIIPALKLGLQKSNGTFITRMDCDDILPSNRLELMRNKLLVLPEKSIVTGKVSYFSDQPVSKGYINYENWLNTRVDSGDFYDHIFRECVIASPNWLVRKEDLVTASIFDDLCYPEDYDMVFRWYTNNFTISGLEDVTLLWREHPERTSRNSMIYQQSSFFDLKMRWFLKLHNLSKKSVGIIGAGRKGKIVAKLLQENKVPFHWYDLKHQNYNNPVMGVSIHSIEKISTDLLLICVYPDNLDELTDYLENKSYKIGKNTWFL